MHPVDPGPEAAHIFVHALGADINISAKSRQKFAPVRLKWMKQKPTTE